MLQGQLRSRKEDFIYKGHISVLTRPFFAQTEQIKRSPLHTPFFLIMSDVPDLDFLTYCYSPNIVAFQFVREEKSGMPFHSMIRILPSSR
jgi:hypothetical protein